MSDRGRSKNIRLEIPSADSPLMAHPDRRGRTPHLYYGQPALVECAEGVATLNPAHAVELANSDPGCRTAKVRMTIVRH